MAPCHMHLWSVATVNPCTLFTSSPKKREMIDSLYLLWAAGAAIVCLSHDQHVMELSQESADLVGNTAQDAIWISFDPAYYAKWKLVSNILLGMEIKKKRRERNGMLSHINLPFWMLDEWYKELHSQCPCNSGKTRSCYGALLVQGAIW